MSQKIWLNLLALGEFLSENVWTILDIVQAGFNILVLVLCIVAFRFVRFDTWRNYRAEIRAKFHR